MYFIITNALIVCCYLTRAGRDIKKDYQLLKDLGYERLLQVEVANGNTS